jgi:hypothetical protein
MSSPTGTAVACSPPTNLRAPHPSQSHREGWDGKPSTRQLLPSPFNPPKISGRPILRSLIAKGGMVNLQPASFCLPHSTHPKISGCPILRSLIAKGGMVNLQPASFCPPHSTHPKIPGCPILRAFCERWDVNRHQPQGRCRCFCFSCCHPVGICFCLLRLHFFSPFSAQKSHVKPLETLSNCNTKTSRWHLSLSHSL